MPKSKKIKCGSCGSEDITVETFATQCNNCMASIDPANGKPFKNENSRIVKTYQFGGIN